MSLISDLIDSIAGSGKEQTVTERPCSNCPSDCAIAGNACTVCEPYKKKLIDTLYYVDHLEEYLSKYEVADLAGEQVVNCPYCGAHSADPLVCEYCGSKLADGTGKIKVEKASDIPNPIMQAQDIIYERADCVIRQYSKTESSSKGILSELLSAITGSGDDEGENPLGAKMSEAEIKEAAELYEVGISEYLTGLDNGKYLTLAGKKELDSSASNISATVIPGVAGVGTIAGAMLGGNYHSHRPSQLPADRDPRPRPNASGQMTGGRPHQRPASFDQGRPSGGGHGGHAGPGYQSGVRGGNQPAGRGSGHRPM